ncbi:MAG: 4Fe-4S dicluster domain-containing protein [Bryobacteraceae bacterium]
MTKAILYDSTRCVGCRECEKACAARWKNPYNDQIAAEERVSAHKLTAVTTHGERFSRKLCMHCQEPTCASVCPVGAFTKTALGPVIYDETKCIGCRYCIQACPFQVPTYEWSSTVPRVRKCNMCYERQVQAKPSACTEACPADATTTGDRDAMIAEARKRIAEKPDGYYPHVYGIREAGGTSVFYLSAVPFEQIGLRTGVQQEALPPLTWKVLSLVPDIATTGTALLGGVYWITHRREAVAREEGRTPKGGKERES